MMSHSYVTAHSKWMGGLPPYLVPLFVASTTNRVDEFTR